MITKTTAFMTILFIASTCLCLGEEKATTAKTTKEAAKGEKPEPLKITHRNLQQMEDLVKQGADPNASYFLFDGLP